MLCTIFLISLDSKLYEIFDLFSSCLILPTKGTDDNDESLHVPRTFGNADFSDSPFI